MIPTAEEDRARRRKATEEAAKVRAIYEEMVLKKPSPAEGVVKIGSLSAMKSAIPSAATTAPVTISNAGGNGHSNGNGNGSNGHATNDHGAAKPEIAEPVAGD